MSQKQNGRIIAIITMMFLYAMIAFVTNLGAPIGVVWKNQPGIDGSNMLGMMGNMMNFLAYLFMGIPAGKMLSKRGYKKSALIGIAVGFVGVLVQYISGTGDFGSIAGLPSAFFIYLLGAFISGFSVCILTPWLILCSIRSAVAATRVISSISSAVHSIHLQVHLPLCS